ncbi:hypothetical protein CONLIGDRAFT_70280 [Coniochaeta ligniaria NRRL 30616]|uniref:Uncharacterized protein n=1 Tax=Coniochaeta ligniaria NRRL 30616 TaxID=1408157 RepID=A0A1J7IBJ9_9PEZI|nr:hypothetical protein CONLIGDRAFT_70280 [Coniochaeta ligniaria NRRL 30616]
MDRTRGPSLASPAQEAAKPAPAPKLRKKLQKIKRPGSGVPNEATNNNGTNNNKLDTPPKISLPLPPDLSDSKWSEYLRSSGYLCATLDTLPPIDSHKPLVTIIPEFSHLDQNHDTPRSSVDTLGSESTDASTKSVRRRAKTPVLHIGQLEARARARKLDEANQRAARMREAMEEACWKQASAEEAVAYHQVSQHLRQNNVQPLRVKEATAKEASANNLTVKETSVKEVMVRDAIAPRVGGNAGNVQGIRTRVVNNNVANVTAEEYRALVATEDSRFSDSRPETPRSQQELRERLLIRHKRRSGDLRRESREFELVADESPQGSPTSDGTLVAFEEETIYFKPHSFSPEPSSPLHSYNSPMASPLPTPNNIGLKICVDLLARDITSAVTRNDQQPPADASALQIWTMIEAYEKLRDRIWESDLRYDELMSLEQSFDMWLKALSAAHDRLTGSDQASESVYDDLERAAQDLELN